MRTVQEAEDWGHGQVHHPSQSWAGLCQSFVRNCMGVPAWAATAYDAWMRIPAHQRHEGGDVMDAPRGVALYFKHASGAARPGHVVLSTKTHCLSNDIYRHGMIDVAPRTVFVPHWGMHYLGWSGWTPHGVMRDA